MPGGVCYDTVTGMTLITLYVQYGTDGPIIDKIDVPNWTAARTQRPNEPWMRSIDRLKFVGEGHLDEELVAEFELDHAEGMRQLALAERLVEPELASWGDG